MKIHWDDGVWAVIDAKDWRLGCARSRTNTTVGDAVKSTSYDAQFAQVPIGPKSLGGFVKVLLTDAHLLAAAYAAGPAPILAPSNYGGTSSKKSIPDYPHKCGVCGGKMLILFSSTEHEGGSCPGEAKAAVRRFR